MINIRIAHVLFLIFVLIVSGCDTQNDFEDIFKDYFVKFYGENGNQHAVDMIVNEDGTMLLLGNTTPPEGSSQIFLVKVDEMGNILWQKTFDGPNETAADIEPTLGLDGNEDGNFIILSNIFLKKNLSTGADEHDIHLIKILPDGEIIEDFQFHAFASQFGNTITPVTSDYVTNGGYIVAGYTTDIEDGLVKDGVRATDLIVFLFNSTITELVWSRRHTNQLDGEVIKVIESETYDPLEINNDRPFYVFGYSDILADGDADGDFEHNFWCVSLTENGSPLNDDFSGDPVKLETMSQTIKANGSGFISVGTQTSSSNQKSIVLTTSEVNGNGLEFNSAQPILVKESKNIEAVSITSSPAGGRYLILANETSATGTTNMFLLKVDITGTVLMSASFGSLTKNDFGGIVRELPNGKIVILGTLEQEPQNSKMALIKINSDGELLD